jgi:hypothetical protein
MARHLTSVKPVPELRFWACFAVVFALLSQAFFPMQAMAMPGNGRYVLCTEGAGAKADTISQKLFAKSKPGFMGMKCVDCVLATITTLPAPAPVAVPVSYTSERIVFHAATSAAPVRARAPPRPHSCGPPETLEA